MAEDKIHMAVSCLQYTLDKQTQRMKAQDKRIEDQKQLEDIFERMTLYGEYDYEDYGDHVGQPSCDKVVIEHSPSEKSTNKDVNKIVSVRWPNLSKEQRLVTSPLIQC